MVALSSIVSVITHTSVEVSVFIDLFLPKRILGKRRIMILNILNI